VCGNETIRHRRDARDERFERLVFDLDLRSGPDNVKVRSRRRSASDTPADRKSDVPLLGRAVDVDKAGKAAHFAALHHAKNAGDNRIASRSVRRYDLARAASILEKRLRSIAPPPIFCAISRRPAAIPLLPGMSPRPNFEVETGWWRARAILNSAIRCSGMR
jgi:hypothetical protein